MNPSDSTSTQVQPELRHRSQQQERLQDPSDPKRQPFKSMGANKSEHILITRVRAIDVITRLRHIPVGFYVSVNDGNVTHRTSNKSTSVGDNVLEWDDELVLSLLDPSSRIFKFTLLASLELGSTLGHGEVLAQFDISVGELLDRNEERQLIKLVDESREDPSTNLSLEIEIERRVLDQNEHSAESELPESETTCRLAELVDMGHHALIRYRELEERQFLEDAIKHLEQARDVCPLDHHNRANVLFNLANAMLLRCRVNGASPDYDAPIDLYRDVLHLRPRGHPDYPHTLLSLAVALLARFQTKNSEADEAEGGSLLSRVLEDSRPSSYVYHAAVLARGSAANFELIHLQKISRTVKNDLSDDKMLHRLDSALQRMFCWGPSGHSLLDPIGNLVCIRPERLRDYADPEKAIPMLEVVVQFTSSNHPDKPLWLDCLGYLLLARYRCSGGVADLERSVSTREEAVRLTLDGHPLKPSWLNNLAMSLSTRYWKLGDVVDLDKSISMGELMVQLTPSGHPDKALGLNILGRRFLTRYERFEDFLDLRKSIMVFEEAVQRTPDSSPDKLARLNNLGYSLWTHYERFSDVADLEKSIATFTDVVRLTPDSHPDKPSRLHNLGISLSTRFERFGDVSDLEKAISMIEDVVRQTPDEHPNKPPRLNDLGNLFSMRYDRLGDVSDLEKSISNHEAALQLRSDDTLEKSSWLNNLGYSLSTLYQRFGNIADLEKSILMTEDAVRLTPDKHPYKPLRLSNLGSLFSIRYDCFGDLIDLEKSILMFEHAARLTPADHPTKASRLNNLGYALSTRYERSGDVADLEQSISRHEHAVQLIPNNHPDKPSWMNNLGTSLLTRYDRSRDVVDLEKSMSMLEDAVHLMPNGHPDKPSLLNNFGRSLSTRHQLFGGEVDLEKSISAREGAVRLTPDGHPDKPFYEYSLALSLLERFEHTRNSSSPDLSQAILYSSRAARSSLGPSRHRFRAAQIWTQCVRLQRHYDSQTLLDAYTVAVDLLSQLAWIGLPLHDRHHQLVRAADTACDAAAAALEAHKPGLAVEWLEQGRSIMWSQLSQLRTPIDGLRTVNSDLSDRFERVSRQLEHATSRWDITAVEELMSQSRVEDGVLQEQAQQHHTLALERERLLAEIRALPGFQRFLLPKTINELSPLAYPGPVVFLNGSKHGCDALIILAGSERVVHIPLPNISRDELVQMRLRLAKLLKLNNRAIPSDEDSDRGARIQGMSPEEVFGSILPSLWDKGISLILEKVLVLSTPGPKLPRIFWCPTGSFSSLPIHAAGHYGATDPGHKVSDYVVSSYIPTMSALAPPPPGDMDAATSPRVLMLAVSQPSTDGQARLRCVGKEMDVIRRLTSSSPSVDLQESDGTVDDVLTRMQASDWVHFACHGTQDRKNPLDSGLLLAHKRRLKVSDIVRLSRPQHGGLAFLSACQTATGDEQLSDEAIHIAAGMLLAGYKGVIATMWTIMDSDAPKVAKEVYERLFAHGEVRPDGGEAAEALHCAIERLRDSRVPFLSWVPFIHVGL